MFLLDTNILSELLRKAPSAQLLKRLRAEPLSVLFTSVVCVAELRRGAALRADSDFFWRRVERDLLSLVTILSYGMPQAIVTGDLYAAQQRSGTFIGLPDLMIAATARTHRLVVVTANTRHFARIPDLPIENWLLS